MAHPRTMNPDHLQGLQVIDATCEKVGKAVTVYLDVEHSKPEWAAVATGVFGTHVSLVSLVNASATGSELTVPYTKAMITSAPHHALDRELSNTQEVELFADYDMPYGGSGHDQDT